MNTEQLIRELATHIDRDLPPGLSAMILARAAWALIRDRESAQALTIAVALNELAARFER